MNLAVDFSKENVYKLLFKLSYPSIIAMLINAGNNIIDGIYLGNLVGGNALAVTAIILPVQMVLMALGTMAPLGAAAMISVKLGSKRLKPIKNIAFTAIIASILLSLLIILIGSIFNIPILLLSGAQGELLKAAQLYYFSSLIGWLFMPLTILGNNLLRTIGEAKKASYIMIISIVVNVIMTPFLIVVFNMGIFGAGLATSLGQFMSFLLMLYYYFIKKLPFTFKLKEVKFVWTYFRMMHTLGFSAFIRQSLNSFAAVIYNNLFYIYGGVVALNAIGIIFKVNTFVLLPIFGILHGFQPIIGYNYGKKDYNRIKEIVNKGLLITVVITLTSLLLVQVFKGPIISIFTPNQDFTQMAEYGMIFLMIGIPFVGISLVGSTMFQSFNKPLTATIIAISRQLFFTMPLLLVLSRVYALQGIWLAFPIADILTGILSLMIIYYWLNKIRKKWKK